MGIPRGSPRAAERHLDRRPDEPLADVVAASRHRADHRRGGEDARGSRGNRALIRSQRGRLDTDEFCPPHRSSPIQATTFLRSQTMSKTMTGPTTKTIEAPGATL